MSYEESFLSVCDEDGLAPVWAIEQIFAEHNENLDVYLSANPYNWDDGELILQWLGR